MITTEQIKQLREETGVSVMQCKKALEESGGDMEKALLILKKKSSDIAAKKADREAKDGMVMVKKVEGKASVVVLNCETDFVARTEKFQEFARNMAIHVANLTPKYVRREEVPAEEVAAEREIQKHRAMNEGKKPEAVIEKIVDGRMEKFFEEIVLLEQPFVKDDSKKISAMLAETVAELGESIQISRFARFKIGESANSDAESNE